MANKITNYGQYLGKWIKIIAINDQVFRGFVSGVDTPEDSEDNQYWIDVVHVDNPIIKKGAEMTVAESEIKEITIIDK